MHIKCHSYYEKRALGKYFIADNKRGKVTPNVVLGDQVFSDLKFFLIFALTRSFSPIGYLALIQKIQEHIQVVFSATASKGVQ